MKESEVADIDNQKWPDPLSVTYNDVSFKAVPTEARLSAADLDKFWLFMQKNYKRTDLDDILLNLNGIPYIGMEQPGDVILKLDIDDIQNFDIRKVSGSESEE